MRVEFSQAFEKLVGRPSLEVTLSEPVVMGEILRLLAQRHDCFAKYLKYQDDAMLGAHLSVFSSGKILRLNDPVAERDTIKIFLPVTGG